MSNPAARRACAAYGHGARSSLFRWVRDAVCEAAGAMRRTGRRRIACALFVGCVGQPPSKRRSVSIKRFFTKNQLKNFDRTTCCIDAKRCNAWSSLAPDCGPLERPIAVGRHRRDRVAPVTFACPAARAAPRTQFAPPAPSSCHLAGTIARHSRRSRFFTASGCAADRRTSTIGQPA